jgi:uncharacterized protein (TIGR02246 family)
MRHHLALALGAAVLLAGASAAASPADLASARAVIDRVDADWLDAMKAKDAERLAEAYAPDGIFVLSDGKTIVGRAAIADFYRARVAKIGQVLAGGIHRDGVAEGAGGLVYEWGHGGSTTVDAAGHRSTSGGPYLTVWKRDTAGAWVIVRNLVF